MTLSPFYHSVCVHLLSALSLNNNTTLFEEIFCYRNCMFSTMWNLMLWICILAKSLVIHTPVTLTIIPHPWLCFYILIEFFWACNSLVSPTTISSDKCLTQDLNLLHFSLSPGASWPCRLKARLHGSIKNGEVIEKVNKVYRDAHALEAHFPEL